MMLEQMYLGFWCATFKVLQSKLDWLPITIEAFWEKKMGAYGFSMRFGILREST